MTRRAIVVAAVVCGMVGICMAQPPATPAPAPAPAPTADAGPLQVLKTFKIEGAANGWDYLTVAPDSRQLFVSHSSLVSVVDADKGTPIGEIPNTPRVHGIALAPEDNLGFTSNGGENTLTVFDLKTLKEVKRVKTGRNPDAIAYDPATKKIFSFNHSGGDITIVDPKALDKDPVTVAVGGTLETGISDGNGRVFVNVEDKNEIVAIDSKAAKVLAHWPLAPGQSPTGMAIDMQHHRLFAGCNGLMVVVDPETGKVLGTVPTGRGVDGVAFDAQLGVAVTSNGQDGTVTVVKEEPAGTFKAIQTLKTAQGARTITCDPKTHQFYLPCAIMVDGQRQFSVIVLGAKS
jgi:DNA-binding beta-propeller fold protein YncE